MPKRKCVSCGGAGQIPDRTRAVQVGSYTHYPYMTICVPCLGTGYVTVPGPEDEPPGCASSLILIVVTLAGFSGVAAAMALNVLAN